MSNDPNSNWGRNSSYNENTRDNWNNKDSPRDSFRDNSRDTFRDNSRDSFRDNKTSNWNTSREESNTGYNSGSRYNSGGYGSGGSRYGGQGRFSSGGRSTSSPMADLPPLPFNKNFYAGNSSINEIETEEFRRQGDMRVVGKDVPRPIRSFSEAQFSHEVTKYFSEKGFSSPTPIQAQGWPMALSGRDMVGIAQTGSGKTLSFVLPAFIHAKDQQPLRQGDGPIVLILAPTRELVLQIKEVVDEYCRFFKLRSAALYGGVSSGIQKRDLERGVEIVVAAPGRLIDLHEQGWCPLGRVSFLVLDEADRMLDMGFEPQLRKIIPKTNQDRQTLMWSATWPKEVRNLAESFMKDYIQVTIGNEELKTNKKIKQVIDVVEERSKDKRMMEILERLGKEKVIIFCNMKRKCDDVEYYLQGRGYKAVAIHGDKTQAVRDRVINDFKSGYKNILIATDVAARGLDIKDIKMVVNYDFPRQIEDYVHRIGRTARGDTAEGLSHSFVTGENRNVAKELIRMLREADQEISRDLDQLANSYAPRGGYGRSNYRRY